MSQQNDFPQFPRHVCAGDSIKWTKGKFTLVARIEYDFDSKPGDFNCYEDEDIERWGNGEWFFCGIVISVHVGDFEIDNQAASLWCIDCNNGSNAHLSEVAQDLESEALSVAFEKISRIREALGEI